MPHLGGFCRIVRRFWRTIIGVSPRLTSARTGLSFLSQALGLGKQDKAKWVRPFDRAQSGSVGFDARSLHQLGNAFSFGFDKTIESRAGHGHRCSTNVVQFGFELS